MTMKPDGSHQDLEALFLSVIKALTWGKMAEMLGH
jgi:hypothetical protein